MLQLNAIFPSEGILGEKQLQRPLIAYRSTQLNSHSLT